MLNEAGALRVFLTADAVGGVWTQVLDLARGLSSAGASVDVATLGPPPSAGQAREAREAGVKLTVTGLPLDWMAGTARALHDAAGQLREMAAASRAHVAHVHAPALAGRADWPLPLVVTAHSCVGTWWADVKGGCLPPDLAWRARMTREGLSTADLALAPSRSFAARLSRFYNLEVPVEPVLNGRTLPDRRGPRALPRSGVLTAGRLWDAGKDLATLDEAAGRIDVSVAAAGPARGPGGESFTPRHLELLGSLSPQELFERYAGAAVFASPAVYEPFGLAALEAAASGAALVLSDIPTFRELWDGAALFFAPRCASALANALGDALHAGDELRRKARIRAEHYTHERMLAGTTAAYRRAVAMREGARAA